MKRLPTRLIRPAKPFDTAHFMKRSFIRRYWFDTTSDGRWLSNGHTLEEALANLGFTIWDVKRWGIVDLSFENR